MSLAPVDCGVRGLIIANPGSLPRNASIEPKAWVKEYIITFASDTTSSTVAGISQTLRKFTATNTSTYVHASSSTTCSDTYLGW